MSGFSKDRSILFIAGFVIALAIVTITTALAIGNDPASFAADTPEYRLQAYLNAIDRGDFDAAYAMLSTIGRQDADRSSFEDRLSYWADYNDEWIVVTERELTGDQAVVTISIRSVNDDGLGFDEYEREQTVQLHRENGEWRIDDPYFI